MFDIQNVNEIVLNIYAIIGIITMFAERVKLREEITYKIIFSMIDFTKKILLLLFCSILSKLGFILFTIILIPFEIFLEKSIIPIVPAYESKKPASTKRYGL